MGMYIWVSPFCTKVERGSLKRGSADGKAFTSVLPIFRASVLSYDPVDPFDGAYGLKASPALADQGFGLAEHQHSAAPEGVSETVENLFLMAALKVDQHVAAENQVAFREGAGVEQVASPEGYHIDDLRRQLKFTFRRPEPALFDLPGDFQQPLLPVSSLFSRLQDFLIDVGAKDGDLPAGKTVGKIFLEDQGGGIGFFAPRAAYTPDLETVPLFRVTAGEEIGEY